MSDFRSLATRLRRDASYPSHLPLTVEGMLPRLYPVATVLLPRLSVARIRDWLAHRRADVPPGLTNCRDRQIRGAVVAWRGHGLLCADAADTEAERRFTFAHEAAHFLGDHFYPRQDLLDRFGPSIQPVLDGLRAPTRQEQVDALLGRTSLTLHTHFMERGEALATSLRTAVDRAEAEADAFACEILAPTAALETRFSGLRADEGATALVLASLASEFGLPPALAARWARRFVARYGEPVTLLHRLRLA